MLARRFRAPLLVVLALGLCACSSSGTVYPPNGTVALDIRDPGLGSQTGTARTRQEVRWTLLSVRANIEGFGSYEYLGVAPCTFTANVLLSPTLQRVCGGAGIVLGAEGPRTATVQLVISAMEVHQAFRPDLPATGDYDGDGVSNGLDNCPILPNRDQTPYPGRSTGVACTYYDSLTDTVYVDNDGDLVDDDFDNCAWVRNVAQTDSNSDGIGNACEQIARVVLGPAPVTITLPSVTINVNPNAAVRLIVQFDDRVTLVGCDPSFTRCYLNPDAIVVKVL